MQLFVDPIRALRQRLCQSPTGVRVLHALVVTLYETKPVVQRHISNLVTGLFAAVDGVTYGRRLIVSMQSWVEVVGPLLAHATDELLKGGGGAVKVFHAQFSGFVGTSGLLRPDVDLALPSMTSNKCATKASLS